MVDSVLFKESGDSTPVNPYVLFFKEELRYFVLIDLYILIYP